MMKTNRAYDVALWLLLCADGKREAKAHVVKAKVGAKAECLFSMTETQRERSDLCATVEAKGECLFLMTKIKRECSPSPGFEDQVLVGCIRTVWTPSIPCCTAANRRAVLEHPRLPSV